jgi:hypothetical protein
MTEVYRIVDIDGKDECCLFCGAAPYQRGLYAVSVLYWKRSERASGLAVQSSASTKSVEDAKIKAEDWIRETLFEKWQETLLREV